MAFKPEVNYKNTEFAPKFAYFGTTLSPDPSTSGEGTHPSYTPQSTPPALATGGVFMGPLRLLPPPLGGEKIIVLKFNVKKN